MAQIKSVAKGSGCPECATRRSERIMNNAMSEAFEKLPMKTIKCFRATSDGRNHICDWRKQGPFGSIVAETDGKHHFPNNGLVYGVKLTISYAQQRQIDFDRNGMTDLMVRIPTATVLNLRNDFITYEKIAIRLSQIARLAYESNEKGILCHPSTRHIYATVYEANVVDREISLFYKYDHNYKSHSTIKLPFSA